MRRFVLHRLLPGLLILLLPLAAAANDGSAAPISVTEGASRVVALSAGVYHNCVVKADASVACWGGIGYGYGQVAAPAGAFVSVSAGYHHSCGVRADGSVDCWGDNGSGQAGHHVGPFVSVSAGYYHSCGVKVDGRVACWGGDNGADFGQLTAPAGVFVSVSAGGYHTCGVKVDGSVACWGGGNGTDYGQVTAPSGAFMLVSAGYAHSCGVKMDGSVVCWGGAGNDFGQVTAPAGAFMSVSAGLYHSCGVKVDGGVACWGGDNGADFGQVTAPAGAVVSVSAGGFHSCGVSANGSVTCWGGLGGAEYGQVEVPSDLGALGFGQLAAGNAHACQVKRDGTLACWGLNDEGQTTAPAGLFTQVVAGDSHSCAIGADGLVTCWGRNGAANTNMLGFDRWRQLAPAPNGAICALNAGGGDDTCERGIPIGTVEYGYRAGGKRFRNITHNGMQLSQGLCGVMLRDAPDSYCGQGGPSGNVAFDNVHVNFFTGGYQRLESGLNHQCGLKLDGSIECWGSNADGQFDNMPASTETFRAFSVGYNHACAIKADGTLACWGSNISGQATPPAGTFVQVAAGNTFTCGIQSDGVRVCWGDDSHGQAPQLALSPAGVPGGQVNVAHAGATFTMADASPSKNAAEPYVIQSPAYAVVAGSLPTGLSLSAAGVLSGTPTAGGSYNFTVEGEDANGFAASHSYTVTIIADSTPPVIGYTLAPPTPNGSNGWYTSNIGIAWSVTDAESSISSKIGCVDETLSTDTPGTTRSCTASSAGGSGSVTTATLKRDATAPTLAPTTPSPLLRGQSYVASANASDATSGVASQSCGALDTSSLGSKSTTCTAGDNAGNSKTVTLNYTVTTTCANDGYTGTQKQWCVQICESGLTGAAQDNWIHRWYRQFRNYPYCVTPAQQVYGLQH